MLQHALHGERALWRLHNTRAWQCFSKRLCADTTEASVPAHATTEAAAGAESAAPSTAAENALLAPEPAHAHAAAAADAGSAAPSGTTQDAPQGPELVHTPAAAAIDAKDAAPENVPQLPEPSPALTAAADAESAASSAAAVSALPPLGPASASEAATADAESLSLTAADSAAKAAKSAAQGAGKAGASADSPAMSAPRGSIRRAKSKSGDAGSKRSGTPLAADQPSQRTAMGQSAGDTTDWNAAERGNTESWQIGVQVGGPSASALTPRRELNTCISRRDLRRFFNGCNLRDEDISVHMDRDYLPGAFYVQFSSREDCERAVARHRSSLGAREVLIWRASHRRTPDVDAMGPRASRGRFVMVQNVPEEARPEDVYRFFDGFIMLTNPVREAKDFQPVRRFAGEPRARSTLHLPLVGRAIDDPEKVEPPKEGAAFMVRFDTAEEASRAVRTRHGGFIGSRRVQLRVLP